MELYGELEVLKRQLAALQGLETDLDAAEAVLDATEPGSTPSKTLMGFAEASSEANVDNEDDADFDVNSIAEMQTKLDEELAEMFAQLKVRLHLNTLIHLARWSALNNRDSHITGMSK